ncbi:hypothetical protein MBM_09806 [Drepanopeziza brunnea f. sp. 'multigermtubi' MB_m1]|uniref:Uncharacterized protein n=1 Tax=Marssonina brunnea f. sp. multigermtubi (strain MB_m1) TaxID=1072389 RepID=K1WIK4_MARBU|nr:uncharacterized protein MBM_09806 [Drepanopeziza brunnea f. sp. 'multigermtubi' MB_m1]EKD12022.1 hypothetical protein MBM_09806 [Drepanopeziza brunnea f. sp. 'multigermtubi' MB_m1]
MTAAFLTSPLDVVRTRLQSDFYRPTLVRTPFSSSPAFKDSWNAPSLSLFDPSLPRDFPDPLVLSIAPSAGVPFEKVSAQTPIVSVDAFKKKKEKKNINYLPGRKNTLALSPSAQRRTETQEHPLVLPPRLEGGGHVPSTAIMLGVYEAAMECLDKDAR